MKRGNGTQNEKVGKICNGIEIVVLTSASEELLRMKESGSKQKQA